MIAATTRPVTAEFPPDAYAILERRAKSEKKTLAQALVAIVEDYIDDDPISEEEEKYLVARAERSEARSKGKRLYTHEEAWGSVT